MLVSNTFWAALVVLGLVAVQAIRINRRARRTRLPDHFDFDHYKSREITQRGVFDKTKWH